MAASESVFALPELLKMILIQTYDLNALEPAAVRHLHALQRVNSTFRDMLTKTKQLRVAMLLEPAPETDQYRLHPLLNPMLHAIWDQFSPLRCNFSVEDGKPLFEFHRPHWMDDREYLRTSELLPLARIDASKQVRVSAERQPVVVHVRLFIRDPVKTRRDGSIAQPITFFNFAGRVGRLAERLSTELKDFARDELRVRQDREGPPSIPICPWLLDDLLKCDPGYPVVTVASAMCELDERVPVNHAHHSSEWPPATLGYNAVHTTEDDNSGRAAHASASRPSTPRGLGYNAFVTTEDHNSRHAANAPGYRPSTPENRIIKKDWQL